MSTVAYLEVVRGFLAVAAAAIVLLATWPVLCVEGEYDDGSCMSAFLITLPWTAEDADMWAMLTTLPAALVVFLLVWKIRLPSRQ